jgi:type VI secretion system secreted protein VgrG
MADGDTQLERVSAQIAGLGGLDVSDLWATESLSTLFSYVVHARRNGATVSPAALIGREASVTIADRFQGRRTIEGVVARAEISYLDHGETGLRFELRPRTFPLTLGRDCRTFHDLDVVGIAREVLAQAGVEVRFELTGTYAARPYTAQYRESDWSFVSRLFEEDGLYTYYDHTSGSVLVVSDASPSAPDIDGDPKLVVRSEAGLEAARDFVYELGPVQRLRPRRVALASFDPARPTFKLSQEAGDDGLEIYDAPGAGPVDDQVLKARAAVRREALAVEGARVAGRSPCVRLAPGRAFDLQDHPFSQYDGRYVVVSVRFELQGQRFSRGADESDRQSNDGPIEVSFEAIPASRPFRAPLVTPVPRHPGLQTGVVIGASGQEVYPDSEGRIRIQQHWDRSGQRDEASGHWVRVMQRGTAGSMLLPRIGWNVLSMGEEGSVDVPVVVSRTFDAEHPPPYSLPENKTQVVYKTATTPGGGSFNELRFEDKKGSEEMFIHSSKDTDVLVRNAKTEFIQSNMTREVGHDHDLDVGQSMDLHVKGHQTVTIAGNQSEKVGADRVKSVAGSETIKIGGSRNVNTGANLSFASKDRTLRVGAVQLEATLGAVSAQSVSVHNLVGGAAIKVTPRMMSENVGTTVSVNTVVGMLPAGVSQIASLPGISGALSGFSAGVGAAFQTIGLLKVELSKSRQVRVAKAYAERVGGMMTLLTNAFTDIATTSFKLRALAYDGSAKAVTIQSAGSVTLKSGESVLTVSAEEGIKLDTPKLDLSGAELVSASAANIKHNDG